MRNYAIRLTLLALLVLGSHAAYAVNDSGNYPCFGVYSLGWLDAEFYWRENTTWYKLDTNDFNSSRYGYAYFCSITAQASDASTVSQGSVPAVCQAASSGDKNSCLVFQAKQWVGDSNRFYRENLGSSPTEWSVVESWLNTYEEASLTQRIWDQKVESTGGGPLLYYFITTNHTDFQKLNEVWTPEDDSWDIYSKMKDLEVRIRTYLFGIGYVWLWYDTVNRTDSYRVFQVAIYKNAGDGLMMDMAAAAVEEDLSASGTPSFTEGETVKLDGYGALFPKLLQTTAPADAEDRETSSLKVEENEKGEAVALTVERVDTELGEAAKSLIEGKTVIAVNGIPLYDLGTIEEQLLYLATEEIETISFAER